MICELTTSDGEFVVRIQIPPFNEPPEVIGWGNRVFVHHRLSHVLFSGERNVRSEPVYREAFTFAAIPGTCEVQQQ